MPRTARLVLPGVPHHVVQRGNRRQRTFFCDGDYRLYLRIAAEAFTRYGVEVWAYCLMPNHVHIVAVPNSEKALAEAVSSTHERYTRAIHQREGWSGYLWQGRFSSSPMDENHLMNCARYVGLNPVRAKLVRRAEDWPWSSAAALLSGRADPLFAAQPLRERLGSSLPTFFDVDVDERMLNSLRRAIAMGRPLGCDEWVEALEKQTGRSLLMRPIGRPRMPRNGDTHLFRGQSSRDA